MERPYTPRSQFRKIPETKIHELFCVKYFNINKNMTGLDWRGYN
jgi:hypothetical protein